MRKKELTVIWVAIVLLAVSGLFPPWQRCTPAYTTEGLATQGNSPDGFPGGGPVIPAPHFYHGASVKAVGYAFIGTPPPEGRLDCGRLLVEWGIIVAVGFGALWTIRQRQD